MSAYLTKAQEKKLLDTYKLHYMNRFHSMNAAVYIDDYFVEFYSYYTHCLKWSPESRTLYVFPIVNAPSPTTTRQINRFLKEYISPRLSVAVLQYGFDASETHGHYDEIEDIDVRYVKRSDTLEKCL